MTETAGPRQPTKRRRAHPAATARILAAGVSAGAGFGIITALALASPPAPDVPAATTGSAESSPAPTATAPPSSIVDAHQVVPIDAPAPPTAGAAPDGSTQPRPAVPAAQPANPAPAPAPVATSRGSS